MRKATIWLLGLFYMVAGANHFVNPGFYLPLIPDYFPFPGLINYVSGVLEVLVGLGVLFRKTRKRAALGIVFLLVLFIPSHVYLIQLGGCVADGLCVPLWVAWVRLIIIHPLLMYWAYYVSKK